MKAQILGREPTDELGLTLAHEHLLANPPIRKLGWAPDNVMDNVPKAIEELRAFARAGGRTLVEGTPITLGRNVSGMVKIAQSVPEVNIIATTGFYAAPSIGKPFLGMDTKKLADFMIHDIREGMEGTKQKAGVIKVAASYNRIPPVEQKMVEAAGRANVEIGAPIQAHTSTGTMGLEILSILKEEGADLRKVLLLHMDQNLDMWLFRKILGMGAYISFDKWTRMKYLPDEWRIEYLDKLVREGFAEQIIITNDSGRSSMFKSYGGYPGLDYIPKSLVPRLRDGGWDDNLIDKILVDNPRRYLTFI